jgi:uncharacterized protein YijF (DUF1287 family)
VVGGDAASWRLDTARRLSSVSSQSYRHNLQLIICYNISGSEKS